jgi:hypothetical protein
MRVGGQPHASATGKTRYPYYTGGWWSSGTVWAGAEYLSRTGIRPPDRPVHSEALYRLSYPGPLYMSIGLYIYINYVGVLSVFTKSFKSNFSFTLCS